MKLLLVGDLHLRFKAPANRLGNFFADQMEKLEYLFEIAKNNECEYILQPGDFCHTHTLTDYTKYRLIDLWNYYEIPLLCVAGQHDLRFHSLQSLEKSSLKLLESARVVEILTEERNEVGPCRRCFVAQKNYDVARVITLYSK